VLNSLNTFIQNHQLFDKSDKLGIAISGGKDSVALAYMLNALDYSFVLIHCNFLLRGEESDGDEAFVHELAEILPNCTELFVKQFETEEYALENGINIQIAARELRYHYFDELYKKNTITRLLTAHHNTDVIETFFINLKRGSGIKGLKSIPIKRDYIVRPFMDFSSDEIIKYLSDNGIAYREDSSNSTNKYLRNKLRNVVLPQLQNALPNLGRSIVKTTRILAEENELLNYFLDDVKSKICLTNEQNVVTISKSKLFSYPQSNVILYYLLDKFGFNYSQCRQIIESCSGESGKQFYSTHFELLVDREELILQPKVKITTSQILIYGEGVFKLDNAQLIVKKMEGELHFNNDPFEEIVSIDESMFPLTLRYWQQGDFIHPLGMTGKKSLSDFFIDTKTPVFEKQNTPLICNQKNVLWVCGKRISNHIKAQKNVNLYLLNIIFDV